MDAKTAGATPSPSRTGAPLDEWSFAIDSRTGNVYFYNRRTRETRWTLPGSESAIAGRSSLINSLSNAHSVVKKVEAEEEARLKHEDEEKAESPSGEKENHIREAIDPHTGAKYYYDTHTRTSYWEDPRKPSEKTEVAKPPTNTPIRSNVTATPSKPENEPLKIEERLQKRRTETEKEAMDVEITLKQLSIPEARSPTIMKDSTNAADDWSSIGVQDTSVSKRDLGLSGTHSSSKSSSQEQVIFRHQESVEFNRDELRLLKERMRKLSTKSSAVTSPAKANLARSSIPSSQSRISYASPPQSSKLLASSKQSASSVEATRFRSVEQSRNARSSPAIATPIASGGDCLRRSGCTCVACSTGVSPVVPESAEDLVPCATCGRRFVSRSLAVHERVCEKVFRKRVSDADSADKKTARKSVSSTTSSASKPTGASKWRKQSQELRIAMQRGRMSSSGPGDAPSAIFNEPDSSPSDDLITCPHCERRFSEKAAERHIPKCKDIKAKPNTLRKGEGKSAFSANLSMNSPSLLNSPSRTPSMSSGLPGRKSLTGVNPNTSTLSERGVVHIPCPFCRRQFSQRSFERHAETCSTRFRNSLGPRVSNAGSLQRRSFISTKAGDDSDGSSWDGQDQDFDEYT